MSATYSPASVFLSACEAQGVVEATEAKGRQGIIALIATLHRGVVEAGIPLRFNALDGPLDIGAMPNIGPVRMLGALANVASGYDQGVDSDFEITTPSAFKGGDGDCPNAEQHWNSTLESRSNGHPPLAEVYVAENGEAVAIRKGRGAVPTVLLLKAVRIVDGNNVPFTYLPGSLVHLSAVGDETRIVRQGPNHKLEIPGGSVVRPWGDVTGVNYLRQTPLAYDDSTLVASEAYAKHVSVERPWQAVQDLAELIIEQAKQA
ncbi:MAG TPA: hypothetical protein VLE99_01185 [Candidatus Saccharimonadales bacterium]|nr:hypothetical protein [Candidatus Saccharimonadales bacterium]